MAMDMTEGEGFGATADPKTIDALNDFLRGEISAVETYRQALKKISDVRLRPTLDACLRSHEQRVEVLRQRVVSAGGQPAKGSGAWGGFARLIEGGAKVLGVKAAIAALEEGEDHGKKMYREDLHNLSAGVRLWVEREIVPLQEHTHNAMSALQRTIH